MVGMQNLRTEKEAIRPVTTVKEAKEGDTVKGKNAG